MKIKYKRRRASRRSTKQRQVIKPRANIKRIITIASAAVLVIVIAVVCGILLGREADRYASEREEGIWTLSENDDVIKLPSNVPTMLASPLEPSESAGNIASYHKRRPTGATLLLKDADGNILYESLVANEAGIDTSAAPSLPDNVARLHRAGLYTVGVFYVSSLYSATGTDSAIESYRRGLELAMLEEYALSGTDEILLIGCPIEVGKDDFNKRTVDFLSELRTRLQDVLGDNAPRIGVNVSPEFMNNTYSGDTTAAILLNYCDYLSLDLRDPTEYPLYGGSDLDYEEHRAENDLDLVADGGELGAFLRRFTYAYQRYSLRLVFGEEQRSDVIDALSHGFDNIIVIK